MMTSNIENIENDGNTERRVAKLKLRDMECSKYMHVTSDILIKNEHFLFCNEANNDIYCNENNSLRTNQTIIEFPEQEIENMLYEDSQNLYTNTKYVDTFGISNSAFPIENPNCSPLVNCKMKKVPNEYSKNSIINNELLCSRTTLNPILYEQCCNLPDIRNCEENSLSLSQSCFQEIEKDFAQYTVGNSNVSNNIGKCIKVYTHKKCKSMDEIKKRLANVNNIIHNPSTDCIDLLDEPSTNDIPVTLLTSLDMESAEYIISLTTENIQSIVGARFNEQNKLNIYEKEFQHIDEYSNQKDRINQKELSRGDPEDSSCMKPILRRSLRLNQQDIDKTANSNEVTKEHDTKEKYFRKSGAPNKLELSTKRKRKVKDIDYRISEQGINNIFRLNKRTFNDSRNSRTKLIGKKNGKSQCLSVSRRKQAVGQSIKITKRIKCDVSETINVDSIFKSPKLNTIEKINRALWGDMSDFLEDYENEFNLDESTQNTEIPFAVGLLPLRTALEKMQATPDYQPRKTRSSVASVKPETNFFKQKKNDTYYSDRFTVSKRQNFSVSNPKENSETVCHIQIRTAPSQYIEHKKKYFTTDIAVAPLEPSTIINKQ